MRLGICLFVVLSAAASVRADKPQPKVFVTGGSFQVSGESGQSDVSENGGPTVAEGIKILQDKCPGVTVNLNRDAVSYIVSLTDDGSGPARKGRRMVLSKPNGDLLKAESDRGLKTAVEHACTAIKQDWAEH